MSKRTFDKWNKILDGSTLTEKEIIYLRKAVGGSGIKDREMRAFLRYKVAGNEYRLGQAHHLKGVNYILDKSLKKNGELRKNARFTKLQLEVIKTAEYHTMIGLHEYCNDHYLPIYRAHSAMGTVTYVGATYDMIQVLGDTIATPPLTWEPINESESAELPDNIVSIFSKSPAKAPRCSSTKVDTDFDLIMERNRLNAERLKAERAKANQSVTRSHRLK